MRRLIAPLLLVAVACQPGTRELTQERRAEITTQVNARNAEFWEAWRAADWDRGMAFYVDSPDFVWASGGAVFFGKSTLEGARSGFANVASQAFAFRETRTVVMAPDAASVTAIGTWSQTDTAGVTGPRRDIAWTGIWILRDGEWKLHLAHLSFLVPALPSAPPVQPCSEAPCLGR
jgi:ketosteroid isomerase-like protein